MMRDFISDSRLHKALDEVESWLDYKIEAVPMPDYYRSDARWSMHLNQESRRFELWCIEGEPESQSIFCHELAHAVLFINGAVTKYTFIDPIPMVLFTPPIRHFSHTIWQYMQHVPIFAMVKELGYDEISDYAPVVESLLALIRQNELFPVMDVSSYDPLKDQLRCQACALVQCLGLPMAEATRNVLRNTARDMIPRSLELADTMLSALGTRTLLDPQEYQEYLLEIYRIAELPRGNLLFSFLDRTSPNFRSRILKVANSEA